MLGSNVTTELHLQTAETIFLEETKAAEPQLWGSQESEPEAGGTGHREVAA